MNLLMKILVPLSLVSISLFLPTFYVGDSASDLLGATTFIYSVLAGFFIAEATSKYIQLRSFIADENTTLSSMFFIASRKSKSYGEEISDAIDRYMIAHLDYPFLGHIEGTTGEFSDLMDISKRIGGLDSHRASLIKINQEALLMSQKSVTKLHWTIIITLALAMALLLLLKRDGTILVSIIVGVILFAIYQVLVLLADLDSNRYLARKLGFKTPQYVFRAIGKLSYYPESVLSWLKPARPYRVGIYKNYPKSFNKTIKVIK